LASIDDYQKMDFALKGLAKAIEAVLKQEFGDLGFALIVFEFGDDKIGNYISNSDRGDMIEVLRNTADRLERRQDIPPACGTIQ
jgi:hypothetical protein